MKLGLSYDDVALVPQFSEVASRLDTSLNTKLTSGLRMKIPILAANMDTIIGAELTSVLETYGSVPIQHRFHKNPGMLASLVKKHPSFISWGTENLDKLNEFLDKYEVNLLGVCVDIAHGHSKAVLETVERLQKGFCSEVIAGNVCTPKACQDLINAGATAIKVGIGPGSVCTTRNITGFGVPQFTAVQDCAEITNRYNIPLIADGGIKSSRDIVLALAAGASSVMIGGLFARCKEAVGKGYFRGQASEEFQVEYYGGLKKGTTPEGVATNVEVDYTASELLEELLGGVRSGMTYGGARTIEELQIKAEFIGVTKSYIN